MTSTVAKAMGVVWADDGKSLVGLGANVHAMLIPEARVKGLFDWVRFDLAGTTDASATVASALSFYGKMGVPVLWIVRNDADVRALYRAGVPAGSFVDAVNEPDRTYSPSVYGAMLHRIWLLCQAFGYRVVGMNVSGWAPAQSGWILAASRFLGDCDVVGSHCYGVKTNHQLWDLIETQRTAWAGMPFLFSEFCIRPSELPTLAEVDDPLVIRGTGSLQARCLASIIRQAMFEKVAFGVYDLAPTDPDIQLLDAQLNPTALYKDLEGLLLGSQGQGAVS